MLDWLRRRPAYTFRTVVYEREGTWVAHAADARLSGFGESKAECLADLRTALESYVESLGGSYRVAVKTPRRTNGELRQLGALITVEIPNPHPQRPAFARPFEKLGWPDEQDSET